MAKNKKKAEKEENRINTTAIEWVKNPDGTQGYTWNPITGCLNHVNGLCKGGGFPCYAYRLAHGRLRQRYLANPNVAWAYEGDLPVFESKAEFDPFYPRFWPERLADLKAYEPWNPYQTNQKPRGIFVCDMGELFGDWVPQAWQEQIFEVIKSCPQHRFYLLTKQPQNLIRWSPFPYNCWVGVTACNRKMLADALFYLGTLEAEVKYVSIEPMLSAMFLSFEKNATVIKGELLPSGFTELSWLIIGACTGTLNALKPLLLKYPNLEVMPYGRIWTLQPKAEWVAEIVNVADRAGVRVFLKNNLRPLLIPEDCRHPNYLMEDIFWASEKAQLRQEMPELLSTTQTGSSSR